MDQVMNASQNTAGQDVGALIQKIKAHGEETKNLVAEISGKIAKQYVRAGGDEDLQKVAVTAMGWEEEGTRHLQMGLMFLLRAVEQPSTFA